MADVNKTVAALILGVLVQYSPILAAQTSAPKESEWIEVASNRSETAVFSFRKGSLEVVTTKGGTSVVTVVGQTQDKEESSVTYRKWYVSLNDCESGIGKLVSLELTGEFSSEADYVAGGASVGSTIADNICRAYRLEATTNTEKSI